jgi:hypothetical protein
MARARWRGIATGDDDGGKQAGRRQCPQGRGQEAHPAEDKARRGVRLDQAQQDIRGIHGSEKARRKKEERQEVQGRAAREVMGKLFLALTALSIAVLIGLSVWVIALSPAALRLLLWIRPVQSAHS